MKLPEMTGLSFDEKPHIYKLNGLAIPSVSKVMEPLSRAEYGTIAPDVLEAAAARGTAVHEAIENWIKFGISGIEPDLEGYLAGFMEWWGSTKPEPVASELRFYHKIMRYGGTADLLAMIDGELNLIDFKTTSRLVEKNCGVQLEAYAQGLASHGINVQRKRILHLTKDGKCNDVLFPTKDAVRWRVFGALMTVYDYIGMA